MDEPTATQCSPCESVARAREGCSLRRPDRRRWSPYPKPDWRSVRGAKRSSPSAAPVIGDRCTAAASAPVERAAIPCVELADAIDRVQKAAWIIEIESGHAARVAASNDAWGITLPNPRPHPPPWARPEAQSAHASRCRRLPPRRIARKEAMTPLHDLAPLRSSSARSASGSSASFAWDPESACTAVALESPRRDDRGRSR